MLYPTTTRDKHPVEPCLIQINPPRRLEQPAITIIIIRTKRPMVVVHNPPLHHQLHHHLPGHHPTITTTATALPRSLPIAFTSILPWLSLSTHSCSFYTGFVHPWHERVSIRNLLYSMPSCWWVSSTLDHGYMSGYKYHFYYNSSDRYNSNNHHYYDEVIVLVIWVVVD